MGEKKETIPLLGVNYEISVCENNRTIRVLLFKPNSKKGEVISEESSPKLIKRKIKEMREKNKIL